MTRIRNLTRVEQIPIFTREGASGEQLNDGAAKPKTGESALTKMGEFTVTPILAVLIIVGAALVIVILVMSAYLCFRRKPVRPKGRRRNTNGGGGSMSRQAASNYKIRALLIHQNQEL